MIELLVLVGDIWHPEEIIVEGLRFLEEEGYRLEYISDPKDYLMPEMLHDYPLIINCKGNNLSSGNGAPWYEPGVTEVMGKDFQQYVENGGSFMAVHAANIARCTDKSVDDYLEFVGSEFINHPARCEINIHKVKDHEILEGVADSFMIRDEHYALKMIAEDADVFLRSTSETGGNQVAGYTRKLGKGRLCMLVPGHILAVWNNPEYQKVFLNAVKWCLNTD